jgi:hypothetical protein
VLDWELYVNYFFEKLKPQEENDARMKVSNEKFLKAIADSISYYHDLYTRHSEQLGVVLTDVLGRLKFFDKKVKGSLVPEM